MSLSYAEAMLALENVNSIDDIELLKNIISKVGWAKLACPPYQ